MFLKTENVNSFCYFSYAVPGSNFLSVVATGSDCRQSARGLSKVSKSWLQVWPDVQGVVQAQGGCPRQSAQETRDSIKKR